jgi:hypothetical protein
MAIEAHNQRPNRCVLKRVADKVAGELVRTFARLHLQTMSVPGWRQGSRCVSYLVLMLVLRDLGVLYCAAQDTGTMHQPPLFYLIENRETGEIIRRGTTTDAGLLPNELILAPETIYRMWLYDPVTDLLGFEDIETPTAGQRFRILPIQLRIPMAPDSDGDGLSDDAEFVIGTDPNNPDTSGTGISDGAAIRQGLNPLQNRPVITGVIASVATPGLASDIYAQSGVAVMAVGSAGVVVFNTANSANPIRVAQVDTPGDAMRVAGSGNLIAVADGAAGLAVVDVSNPSLASIVRQVNLGGSVQAVAAAAGIAFVGTGSGQLVSVDLGLGIVLDRLNIGSPIQDIGIGKEVLYVLTDTMLYSVPLDQARLQVANSAMSPISVGPNRRLFVGDLYVYAVQPRGVNTFSVADPLNPALVDAANTSQLGWKQFVPTGSRFAVAAVSPNLSLDGPHDVSIYDLTTPTNTQMFITTLTTPGVARAVSIYNGLAYVADSSSLQVVNYLAFDTGGVAPTISLTASFPLNPAQAEEGKIVRVTAQVTDDVQVRNVEFYLDGQQVPSDGNFPFEHRFVTALRSLGQTNFTVQARAFDTGGNATWSELLTVALVPDATPPQVSGTFPANSAIVGALSLVSAKFNEPINSATLTSNSFRVALVGTDGLPGTADDVFVSGGALSYNDSANLATLTFPTNLAPGAYSIRVQAPIADLAGNAMTGPFVSRFWITGGLDSDQDGIPDDIELLMGLNPNNPDSNGNGVWDGDEDSDGDGLRNSWEILWNLNPLMADSNETGIPDGQRDPDQDGLTNLQEQAYGTNPDVADTDGDGWNDETEISGGSDPLNPGSRPKLFFVSSPPAALAVPVIPARVASDFLMSGTVVARPSAALAVPLIPDSNAGLELARGTVVAHPPVALAIPVIPSGTDIGSTNYGAVIAAPPAQFQINTQ